MAEQEPVTELCAFSSPGAVPTEWAQARGGLRDAEVYWLSTVRPDGRPHVTTLLGVWLDGALYFCTGLGERKARNPAQNPHGILTTGRNDLADGVDLVAEGDAATVSDEAELNRVADTYESIRPAFHGPRGHLVRSGGRHPGRQRPGVPRRSVEGPRFRQGQEVQPDPVALLPALAAKMATQRGCHLHPPQTRRCQSPGLRCQRAGMRARSGQDTSK